jgi:hypothetical protein
LPKPPKHEAPLTIKFPDLDKTSAEWLKINGLKGIKSPERAGPGRLTRHGTFKTSQAMPQS